MSKLSSNEKVGSFDNVYEDITSCAEVPSFTGFVVTHYKEFSKDLNLVQTLSIMPRQYEVGLCTQVNEQKNPGYYHMMIAGNIKDLPFRITCNGFSRAPEFVISLPNANRNSTTTFITSLNLNPKIVTSYSYQPGKISLDAQLVAYDKLSKGQISVSLTTLIKQAICGVSFSRGIESGESVYNVLTSANISPEQVLSAALKTNFNDNLTASASSSYTIDDKTSVAVEWHCNIMQIRSEVCFGLRKNFLMSQMYASMTRNGVLSSYYTRALGGNSQMRLTFSSVADIPSKNFTFGVSLNIQ